MSARSEPWVWLRRLTLPFLALAALALALSFGHAGTSKVEAAGPAVEFNMEVVSGGTPFSGSGCTTKGPSPLCVVPVNGAFVVEVRLDDPASLSGQITGWQAVLAWTFGLQGPGDPSSTKQISVANCPGQSTTAAPSLGVLTAGARCAALPPPFTDAQATAIRAQFELNCDATPSFHSVTLLMSTFRKADGTHVTDPVGVAFSDVDGSEAITIVCAPPDGRMYINASPPPGDVKVTGTCWQISYLVRLRPPNFSKVPYDVVGDDSGGVKPDCGQPSNQNLFDKNPAPGNLLVTIPGELLLVFSDIWFAKMIVSPTGELDPTNYQCDLFLGKCAVGAAAVGGFSMDLGAHERGVPLQGSSPSEGLLAGLIAGASAGVIGLGAAWYARRAG